MKDKLIKTKTIRFGIIIVACIILGVLNSCETREEPELTHKLVMIDNVISYDSDTKVIYYRITYNGYVTPYYSENGKLCRYIDGKIVEIK